mmetsp:Transcript_67374/g.184781  ORF Transcript_67374/g.184781 Transcript_67374/m.184781 type:complete len:218 (+) Transcript_67374:2293-2946(+)
MRTSGTIPTKAPHSKARWMHWPKSSIGLPAWWRAGRSGRQAILRLHSVSLTAARRAGRNPTDAVGRVCGAHTPSRPRAGKGARDAVAAAYLAALLRLVVAAEPQHTRQAADGDREELVLLRNWETIVSMRDHEAKHLENPRPLHCPNFWWRMGGRTFPQTHGSAAYRCIVAHVGGGRVEDTSKRSSERRAASRRAAAGARAHTEGRPHKDIQILARD